MVAPGGARLDSLIRSSSRVGLWAMPRTVAAVAGRFASVHATLQSRPLEVLEKVPQDLGRGEHEEGFALFRREPEPDERGPDPDHGVARHIVEIRSFPATEALPGDVDTFLREPSNRSVGAIDVALAHPQWTELAGRHSSSSVAFTLRACARRCSTPTVGS